jgi:hypothetical protein
MLFEIAPATEAGTVSLRVYGTAVAYTPAEVTANEAPEEILVGPSVQTLTESAALSIADRVKVVLGELAKSTRTSNGVERLNDIAAPLTVLVTLAGNAPPYILTVPKGKDAVLVLVPVTAMPLASVRKVRLIEPWTVALTPKVPEPV